MNKLPYWFYLGIFMNFFGWAISWLAITPFSYYTFIFIWGGFILLLDGINYKIKGSSLLTRNKKAFIFLFLLSTVFWWYFEIVVLATKNWYYIGTKGFSLFEHQVLGSLYFSTIIPATFEVVELIVNLDIFKGKVSFIKFPKNIHYLYFILAAFSFIAPILKYHQNTVDNKNKKINA